MLVLKRSRNERIRMDTADGFIWITVIEIDRGYVRLGIEAPKSVKLMREELLSREEQRYDDER